MARGRVRLEGDQIATLWVPLAEPLRDKSEHPESFTVRDVHPLLQDEAEAIEREPDWALWSKITQHVPVKNIDLKKLNGIAIN